MPDIFSWKAAEEKLYDLSKNQILQYEEESDKDDVYGFGFFCDAFDGIVYLVANITQFHLYEYHRHQESVGRSDPEVFKWYPGNWDLPGGLFPSNSVQQHEFDRAWQEYGQKLSLLEGGEDERQVALEELCLNVLKRLIHDGAFSAFSNLEGVTIIGPFDSPEMGLKKMMPLKVNP
jgi:hypothetical protein